VQINLGIEELCETGKMWVPMELHTGEYASNYFWEIDEKCKGEAYSDFSHYYFHCCLETEQQYDLTCETGEGDETGKI
jgi:hypothetical protein